MPIKDLIDAVTATTPNMSRNQVVHVVKATFKQMQQEIGNTAEGSVSYAGLGSFKVKKVMAGKTEEKTEERRVVFVAKAHDPEAKAKKKAAAA